MNDPLAVAAAYLRALDDQRWAEAGALYAPSRIARFSREVSRFVPDEQVEPTEVTVERMRENDPNAPVEVLEYLVARSHRVSEVAHQPRAGQLTREEIESLSLPELVARHLEVTEELEVIRRYHAALIEQYPEYREQLETQLEGKVKRELELIGAVQEDGRAYVLYRWSNEERRSDFYHVSPHMLCLNQEDGEWRIDEPILRGGFVVGFSPVRVQDEHGDWIRLGI